METVGYFFCLEDRALLCRKCDVAIHTVNSFVSGHRRFLLTGVKVGFETTEPVDFSTKEKTNYAEKSDKKVSGTVFKKGGTSLSSLSSESNHVLPYQATGVSGPLANKTSFSGGCGNGNFSDWHLDEFLGVADFNQNFGFMECGSSKADSGKLGDSDSSPNSRAAIENFDTDECLGEVPEISWIVPEMLSPPTASGLFWSKSYRSLPSNSAVFVPDVCSTAQSFYQYESNVSFPKRRRQS
ncbi:hypothetical protein GIB67_039796 [Kingdonia uniflora]|uniref:B box-type domain-containing protein n=1 Tax=Kingdonia uniflora TaxID=39325 RepID=A0A7J7P338_9MAGN|nr:hypothetical protein GIB67_039796 [Kingdonia uniflora]